MSKLQQDSVLIILGVISGSIGIPLLLDPAPDLTIGIGMVAGSFLTAIALIVWD